VYRFFAKRNPGLSDRRELSEHDLSIPMVQELEVLSNRTLPAGALDLDGVFRIWQERARAQNDRIRDLAFLRARLRQTLAVEMPLDVISEIKGRSIVLSRASKRDRVAGIWIDGKGKPAIVIDAGGSASAIASDVVKRLQSESRPILLIDAFQTGVEKVPRAGDVAVAPIPRVGDHAEEEESADAAAGYGKFLTFNVSVDAARVQDIVTAVAYASRKDGNIDVFASGDAAVWATFAAAVSDAPMSLHVERVPTLETNADYVGHFNVAGILRAGGFPAAMTLVNGK
jgi:hypothetical protein